MPDASVTRPFGEFDFDDLLWPDPMRIPAEPSGRRRVERRSIDLELFQVATQPQTEGRAPAGSSADFTGEAQRIPLVVANQYRANTDAGAGRIRETANHELL